MRHGLLDMKVGVMTIKEVRICPISGVIKTLL